MMMRHVLPPGESRCVYASRALLKLDKKRDRRTDGRTDVRPLHQAYAYRKTARRGLRKK